MAIVRRFRVWPLLVVLALVVSQMAGGGAAPAAPAGTQAPAAHIDPALLARVGGHTALPAVLSWDERRATRHQVADYLAEQGIGSNMLEMLPMAFACVGSAETVRALAAAPGALSVWGDEALTPALDHSVPTAFNGDPNAIWKGLGVTGKGVGIAVVDTGVDATHPDLQYGVRTKLNIRVIVSHQDVLGPYYDPCVADTYTGQLQDSELTSGHGTHIASVAAGDGTVSGGRYTGVAPEADIVGVGVADTTTPQLKTDVNNVQLSLLGAIAAINYVLINGLDGALKVKVILAGWTQKGLYDPWHPMALSIRDLNSLGINIVFPVGNDGPAMSDCSSADTCHINPWSASPSAITVAATPRESRTSVEPYSSAGDPVLRTARNLSVLYNPTLAAPGTGVVAARRPGFAPVFQPPGSILGAHGDGTVGLDRRYVALTGTSVSAAHVAGAIALMQQAALEAKGCYLTADQVISALRSTATAIPGAPDWRVGAGAVDITAAVYLARSMPAIHSPEPWMCPS